MTLDPTSLQQQAEQFFELLLQLLQQAITGFDAGKAKIPPLLSAVGSVARQRPAMLASAVDIFKKILQQRDALGDGWEEVRQLVTDEVQLLLASGLTSEWHPELTELLVSSLPRKGSLEDLATQAKYKQICAAADREGDGPLARAKKRARKADPKHVGSLLSSRVAT